MSVRLTSSPYLVVVTVGLVLLLLSCLSLAHGQSEPVVISSSNGRPVMALPLTVSTNLTWSTYGGNLANTHATSLSSDVIAASVTSWLDYTASPGTARPSGLVLTPLTVPALELKWSIPFTAPIVCSPAVDSEGNLYLAEYGGLQNLYKIDGATGDKIWAFNVSHIPQLINSTDGVRTTPALSPAEDVIVVGSQTVGLAYMMGFATANGSLLWITQLDTHPAAFITGSPSIDPTGQYVFASVSSNEESLVATQPGYVCCSFRGSVALLDVYTGSIVWQFYMIPANLTGVGLYSGAAVWGSSAPFDDEGVLVATGNLYDAPNATQQCVNDTLGTPAENDCVPDDIYQEVVLKLNVSNGEVMWAFHSTPYDAWTSLCGLNQALGGTKQPPTPYCPVLPYEDALDRDFGQDPVLFGDRYFAIGQKSGLFYMRDRYTGEGYYNLSVGPPGVTGGSQFGSAVEPVNFDYTTNTGVATADVSAWRLYAGSANSQNFNDTLLNGTIWQYGSFIGIDAISGTVLWKTPLPDEGQAYGTVSAANGVMFGGSTNSHFYALDGSTGDIIWTFKTDVAVVSGPAITSDSLYWGTGNNASTAGTLYAFTVNPAAAPTSGVLGDPQFIGLRGQSFQVHGIDGAVYNLIIDDLFHLNARFVFLGKGRCPAAEKRQNSPCWSHPGSYLGSLGLKTADGHTLQIDSGSAESGFATVLVDGLPLAVGQSVATAAEGLGQLTVHRLSSHRLSLSISSFEVDVDNSDMFVNLARVAVRDRPSLHSHGLLGQTWSAPVSSAAATQIACVEGAIDDYVEAANELLGRQLLYHSKRQAGQL